MRHWMRATYLRYCGHCPAQIPRGEPFLELTMTNVGRTLVRCPACADEPVPTWIAPLAVDISTPSVDVQLLPEPREAAPTEWMPYRDGDDR